MKVALVQFNSLIGGVGENLSGVCALIKQNSKRADLFVLPELALIGYPPRDLLSYPHYLNSEAAALQSLKELSRELKIGILVSHCEKSAEAPKGLWSTATLFDGGNDCGSVRKSRLPYYDIFEEERFFSPYLLPQKNLEFRGKSIGVFICEDAWDEFLGFGKSNRLRHSANTGSLERLKTADFIVNLSSSPFSSGKSLQREELFKNIATKIHKPVLYANSWGAQDDIVFDGRSFAMNVRGEITAMAKAFQEDCLINDPLEDSPALTTRVDSDRWQEIADALVCGVSDYAKKTSTRKLLLGMSGGIDSALVCWIAQKAVGPENVLAVSLPTEFNSAETRSDARRISEDLGVQFREILIQENIALAAKTLKLPHQGLAFENLQSRTRGLMLMALSNESGALLLACGNKSELAMGYSTLYGDLCGALLPIGDLFKTDIFGLCRWINAQSENPPFPESILNRAPSAELAPGQKDSDSLPEYSILDAYLEDFIENQGLKAIEWKNFPDAKTQGDDLYRRFTRQEFKRRQTAPILKMRVRSFGSGWRMPIAKSSGLLGKKAP